MPNPSMLPGHFRRRRQLKTVLFRQAHGSPHQDCIDKLKDRRSYEFTTLNRTELPLIHVTAGITTHLPTPEGWKAELD